MIELNSFNMINKTIKKGPITKKIDNNLTFDSVIKQKKDNSKAHFNINLMNEFENIEEGVVYANKNVALYKVSPKLIKQSFLLDGHTFDEESLDFYGIKYDKKSKDMTYQIMCPEVLFAINYGTSNLYMFYNSSDIIFLTNMYSSSSDLYRNLLLYVDSNSAHQKILDKFDKCSKLCVGGSYDHIKTPEGKLNSIIYSSLFHLKVKYFPMFVSIFLGGRGNTDLSFRCRISDDYITYANFIRILIIMNVLSKFVDNEEKLKIMTNFVKLHYKTINADYIESISAVLKYINQNLVKVLYNENILRFKIPQIPEQSLLELTQALKIKKEI